MNLDIFLSPLLVDAQKRKYDIYVVIDLFRATTAFCTAFNYGIKEILPFADMEEARAMKRQDYLIAGERNGDKLEGFDFGNSPFGFMDESLKGKSLAFTTTNGTKCIETVKGRGQVVIASYNNLSTVIDYLLAEGKDVALVCSGWKGQACIEDSLCAGAIADELLKNDFVAVEDSVFICRQLFLSAQKDELKFIVENSARVAGRIEALGDDFRKCLEKDIYSVLPVLTADGSLIDMKC